MNQSLNSLELFNYANKIELNMGQQTIGKPRGKFSRRGIILASFFLLGNLNYVLFLQCIKILIILHSIKNIYIFLILIIADMAPNKSDANTNEQQKNSAQHTNNSQLAKSVSPSSSSSTSSISTLPSNSNQNDLNKHLNSIKNKYITSKLRHLICTKTKIPYF